MAYGSDITQGLPYILSNPVQKITYAVDGAAYDVSINGLPFYVFTNEETPYNRKTAQYRKNQIDQSNEPGEQTLTGWWLRSQSSFHRGTGIKFYDPSAGEEVQHRFADSKGINVWTKGKTSLLRSCTQGHIMTGPIATTGRPQQHLRAIRWNGTDGVLLLDEYDVDKIDASGTVTNYIDYNAGVGVYPVYSICDDGVSSYWVTNATSPAKLTIYKKPLTGSAASTADETVVYSQNGLVVTNAVMEYVKERIVACINNKVYELNPNATSASLPTELYTNPSTTFVYTSVAASGPAIYAAGYNGIQSNIQKFALSATGAMPAIASAVVAAEMPRGELIHKISYYLGYMIIGTTKGIRVAAVSDQDGSISYGPLIVETSQPCYDFTFRDKYVWCATGVAGEPGLIRIDLGTEIQPLVFAYANDIYYPGVSGKTTTACAFSGTTDRVTFATANSSGTDGNAYSEASATLMSSGYITTGRIRYSTLENKAFKFFSPRLSGSGQVIVKSIDRYDKEYLIANYSENADVFEAGISYPPGSQEFLSFKVTMYRSSTNTTAGVSLNGYQVKALPAIPRQRILQYPLACFDSEKDKFGTLGGYEGSAYDRLSALEQLENIGDTIRVDDFRTGEAYTGIIEEIQFVNKTPVDKRFSGVGGVLYATIRSL